ncbi:MAG: phospho-N-acetylmuramoyl-pentapeptide-transferase [Simkaniaceae bacterium]|nr:phospho-N-acetylmuramoyl-pentapeptide-transferase [Simkaniaceae bacterium]
MILWLLEFFKGLGLKVPMAFSYSSTRMVMCALTTLCLTIFLGKPFIRMLYALKMGQPIRNIPVLGDLHAEKKDTPTMGGILMLSSLLIASLLWMDLSSPFSWIVLFVLVMLGVIGGRDDYLKLRDKSSKGMRSKVKFGLQLLTALAAMGLYFYLWPGEKAYYIPFFKSPIWIGGALSFLFSLFVITGSSNAVNLSDGLDALASGLILMVAVVMAIFAFLSNHVAISGYLNILYIPGSGEIAIFLLGMAGACLGFMWYNGHPAQVFMGDVGSLTFGGLLGVCAVLLRRELLLALVGGVFVAEALSVILQVASFKLRGGRRIFLCAPVHHHFEYKGWAETKVVIRFWIVGYLLAMIGLASLRFQ